MLELITVEGNDIDKEGVIKYFPSKLCFLSAIINNLLVEQLSNSELSDFAKDLLAYIKESDPV